MFATLVQNLVNCYWRGGGGGGGGSLPPLQIISLSNKWIRHLSTRKTGSRIAPIFGRSSDAPGLTSSHKGSKPKPWLDKPSQAKSLASGGLWLWLGESEAKAKGSSRGLQLPPTLMILSPALRLPADKWINGHTGWLGNLTLAGSSKDPKNDQPLEATDQALVAKSRNSQAGLATEDDAHHIPQQSLAMSPRTKCLGHTPPVREATARIAKAAEQQLGFENLKQPGTREEYLGVLRHRDEKPALDGQSIWKNGRGQLEHTGIRDTETGFLEARLVSLGAKSTRARWWERRSRPSRSTIPLLHFRLHVASELGNNFRQLRHDTSFKSDTRQKKRHTIQYFMPSDTVLTSDTPDSEQTRHTVRHWERMVYCMCYCKVLTGASETSLDASIAALEKVTAAGFTKAAADLVKSKPTYIAIGDTQALPYADELRL
ncbi:hypothetical protein K438DRAFT_2118763 [Mycena galopus ATCC 62051]|nr:hypothetical protein K438DRAFT_2118763 [Mycena galopus ATCC 62051]